MLHVAERKVNHPGILHHFLELDVDLFCQPSMSVNNQIVTVFLFSCHSNILLMLRSNVLIERRNTDVAEESEGDSCQR